MPEIIMTKPALLTVDDDAEVLRAIERDLRRKYASEYRVLRAESGAAAMKIVRELKLRNNPVALFLVDQRMPGVSGVEFLQQALELIPDAKRVLLTAYADTDAAIAAINAAGVNHYLLKPWDPPEENLYPVIDDLLEDWKADFPPPFEGIRVLGNRWSPESHNIKDFLARNHVPYQWLDIETVETDSEVRALLDLLDDEEKQTLPLVIFPNGLRLQRPILADLAKNVGLRTRAAEAFYDLAIVGGGPAGLAAAVYGASEGLRTVMVEREAPGGQAGTTSRIENYLGFPAGLSGGDLARRALTQARRLGAEILSPADVRGLRREDPYRIVVTDEGEISCQTVIVATGVSYRTLDLPDAERLAGAGVYYGAATTEAVLYRDAEVGVVGGGNSAGQAVVYLARFATRVHLVIRGDANSGMSQYLIEQIDALPNVVVHLASSISAVRGASHLEEVTLTEAGVATDMPMAAMFVFIGQQPRTDWLGDSVMRDRPGFLLTGPAILTDGRPPAGWGSAREPLLLETSM